MYKCFVNFCNLFNLFFDFFSYCMGAINCQVPVNHYVNLYLNSGETASYLRGDVALPNGTVTVKAVTERGNMAVFSSG